MKTLWPNMVTLTALLLGLAGVLATGSGHEGAQRTTLTCHVSSGGSSPQAACR